MKKLQKVLLATFLMSSFSLGVFAENSKDANEMSINLNFSSLEKTENFDVNQLESYISTLQINCTVTVTVTVGVVTVSGTVSGPCSEIGDAVKELIELLKDQLKVTHYRLISPINKTRRAKPRLFRPSR